MHNDFFMHAVAHKIIINLIKNIHTLIDFSGAFTRKSKITLVIVNYRLMSNLIVIVSTS